MQPKTLTSVNWDFFSPSLLWGRNSSCSGSNLSQDKREQAKLMFSKY